ncbi:MAG: type II secretion system protein, partial [Candidatus Omnitrophota bacterium]
MMSPRKKASFTLIELVIVITILAILGSISIPIFADLRQRAAHEAEKAVMVSLKESVTMFFSRMAVEGTPRYYGTLVGETNPFGDLMSASPPYLAGGPPNPTGDGLHWHYGKQAACFFIWCPH